MQVTCCAARLYRGNPVFKLSFLWNSLLCLLRCSLYIAVFGLTLYSSQRVVVYSTHLHLLLILKILNNIIRLIT